MVSETDFMECSACAAKPGSPVLCPSCIHNRAAIAALRSKVREQEKALALRDAVSHRNPWRTGDPALRSSSDPEPGCCGGSIR